MPQTKDALKKTATFYRIFNFIVANAKLEADTVITYNLLSDCQGKRIQNLSPILLSVKFAQSVAPTIEYDNCKYNTTSPLALFLTTAWHPLYAFETLRRQLSMTGGFWQQAKALSRNTGLLYLYKGLPRATIIPTSVLLVANDEFSSAQRLRS